MKNEKGYALVTVLLITLLVVTISGFLINSIITNRTQITHSEKEIQGIDLAEIGIVQYETQIANMSTTNNFCDQLTSLTIEENVDSKNSYKVKVEDPTSINCSVTEDKTINVRSEGIVDGKVEHVLNGVITLNFEDRITSIKLSDIQIDKICGPAKDYDYIAEMQDIGFEIIDTLDLGSMNNTLDDNKIACKVGDDSVNGGVVNIDFDGNTYINNLELKNTGTLNIDGNAYIKNADFKNKATFNINGIAYFDDVQLKNSPEIIITGDAYFRNLEPLSDSDKLNNLVIKGDFYFDNVHIDKGDITGNAYGKILKVGNNLDVTNELCYKTLEKVGNGNVTVTAGILKGNNNNCKSPPSTIDQPIEVGSAEWELNPEINIEYYKE